jgi:hypothetical protein
MLETESTGKEMIKISGGVRMMLVGLAAIVLLLAACSGEDSSVSLPEGVTLPESAPEVDAPDPTQAEAPAAADDEVPVCVWVLLGLGLVGLVAWLGARAGSGSGSDAQQAQQPPPQQPTPPPPTTDQEPPF